MLRYSDYPLGEGLVWAVCYGRMLSTLIEFRVAGNVWIEPISTYAASLSNVICAQEGDNAEKQVRPRAAIDGAPGSSTAKHGS